MIELPPELISTIIKAAFIPSNPYSIKLFNCNASIFYKFSLVSKSFQEISKRIFITSINLTEENISPIKQYIVGIYKKEEESLAKFIRRISIGESVRGTGDLLEKSIGLKELWIECSATTGVSSILEFPKSIHTLHLHSETRGRWLDLSHFTTTINVARLAISSTFISPLYYAAFPHLTSLSILIEHSCNIAPDNLVEIFERLGQQLLKLQILQYGKHLAVFPYHSFQFLTQLKHFSISGNEVIPLFLEEIPSLLISMRYVNSYSDFLPQKLLPLPFCLSKVRRIGFPIQHTDRMKGREGLDEWASERDVKIVELELKKGIWQEDLELLDW